jgi:hypothetical protein
MSPSNGTEMRAIEVEPLDLVQNRDVRGTDPDHVATGTGSEVWKRIAAPIVGGIFTSFVLELVVYPVIYEIWKWHFEMKRASRHGAPGEVEVRPGANHPRSFVRAADSSTRALHAPLALSGRFDLELRYRNATLDLSPIFNSRRAAFAGGTPVIDLQNTSRNAVSCRS